MSEENLNENDQPKVKDTDDKTGDDGKFQQQMKSWVGRVEAQGKTNSETNARILEALDDLKTQREENQLDTGEGVTELDEKVQALILEGKPMEAFQIMQDVQADAARLLNNQKTSRLEKAYGAIKDQPEMKEIGPHVKEMAENLLKQGTHTPEGAVSYAKLAIENQRMGEVLTNLKTTNPGALEMLKKGNPAENKGGVGGTLPAQFEKAFQQCVADGIYKAGEQEAYINDLSPAVRADLGL